MFSPVIRALITSLPCCTQPSLIIPNCSTTVVQHLVKILECGYTTGVPNDSFKQVYEIIELAKILDIDISDLRRDMMLNLPKKVLKHQKKVVADSQNITAAEIEDDNDSTVNLGCVKNEKLETENGLDREDLIA